MARSMSLAARDDRGSVARHVSPPDRLLKWSLQVFMGTRTKPHLKRARGDGPEAFSSRNMDRPPHVAATSRPMLRLAFCASLSPLWT